MTNEEKKIIAEYFKQCGAKADDYCLERIEKEELTGEFLEYAKNKDYMSPCGIYTIVAYGGF